MKNAASVAAMVGLIAHAGTAGIAQAQDTPGLEEVIVTAERRAVGLEDVPISAVAHTGETLERRGVVTFEELQYNVPSVTFVDTGNSKFINIRGVGVSESAPHQTTGVAIHLDGGYLPDSFVWGDAFFDMESVEVLRGPQGTYAGQNASGGAIFMNTRAPVIGETSGFVGVEHGNYDLQRYSGAVTIPLSETWAARVSGDWEQRDSFYDNHGPDLNTPPGDYENQPGNLERSLGRFQLLYEPSDDLSLRMIYEVSHNHTDGVPYQWFPEYGTNDLPASGARTLNYDIAGERDVRYQRATAVWNWAATEAFSVVGNVSFFNVRQHLLEDRDLGSPATDPSLTQEGADFLIEPRWWTGELTLVSAEDGGAFEWTTGISYVDHEVDNSLNFLRYNNAQFPGTSLDVVRHTRLFTSADNMRRNFAVFGEIGYELVPEVQVKLGLRYNRDKKGFLDTAYASAGPVPPGRLSHYNSPTGNPQPAAGVLNTADAFTGRVLVNWTPSDGQLFYSSISRGYKPGGNTAQMVEYDEEYVLSYELGWKGGLLNDTVSASVSTYYMEYDGFQRTYSTDPDDPTARIVRNVDGSTIKGIEAQLTGRVNDFRWDLSFAYNRGVYGDLELVVNTGAIDGVNPVEPGLVNLKGQAVEYLPELSYNVGVSYEGFELGRGRLIPALRASYQDEYYTSFFNFDYNLTPSKTVVDAFLTYEADENWRVELYSRNLFDEEYIIRAEGQDQGRGQYLLGKPRQTGIRLRYDF